MSSFTFSELYLPYKNAKQCAKQHREEKREKKKQSESAAGISLSSISFDRKTRESMKQKTSFQNK